MNVSIHDFNQRFNLFIPCFDPFFQRIVCEIILPLMYDFEASHTVPILSVAAFSLYLPLDLIIRPNPTGA